MNKQEAYQKALDYYNGDELAAKTLINKYCLNDGKEWQEATWPEVAKRVAKNINQTYGTEEEYRWLLENKYFVPGGRALFAIGNPYNRASIANCYVIPIKGDDIESIFEAAKEAAKTYAYGGGVGLILDILRPSDAVTNNAAKTSTGVVSFMELYSKAGGVIGQSGRRSATLLGINVAHPDVEKVIEAKATGHDIRFANISIIISDEFMQAVENDEDWDLWHPELIKETIISEIYDKLFVFQGKFKEIILESSWWELEIRKEVICKTQIEELYQEWIELQKELKANIIPYGWYSPYYLTKYEDYYFINDVGIEKRRKKIYRTVKARDLWHKIAESAWKSAEPGVIFMDNIKKRTSHTECNFMEVLGTNPCLRRDTLLFDGDRLSYIYQGSKNGNWTSWKTGVKDVIELHTNIGLKFKCTPDHKIRLADDSFVEAKDTVGLELKHPSEYVPHYKKEVVDDKIVLLGFLFGDGYMGKWSGVYVCIDKNKEPAICELLEKYGFYRLSGKKYYINKNKLQSLYDIDITPLLSMTALNKELPDEILLADRNFLSNFFTGLFEANGACNVNGQISYKTISKKLAEQIQVVLLSLFGIHASITKNEAKDIKWHNGVYRSRESYNVQIPQSYGLKFLDSIGFWSKRKNSAIRKTSINKAKIIVKEIRPAGKEEVWDFNMTTPAQYNVAGGLVVHNCGELPLVSYGNCNLGNLNLSAMVDDEGEIDFDLLKKATDVAVRFLNDMLDYGIGSHPLRPQQLIAYLMRKIGLGITGLADMLLKSGIRYGSSESIDIIGWVMFIIREQAVRTSIELAKKHGSYLLFNPEGYKHSEFFNEVFAEADDELKEDFKKYGIYNSGLLTCPPVGSGSIILQTSTGIEPVFAWKYTKKTESVEAGEYDVYHPYLKEYLEKYNLTYEEWEKNKEDYWVTAHDLNYKDRVKMQGLITKYVDSSVSSTVNLPDNTTVEQVLDLYSKAYKEGCKGITIYRDGCLLEGVLKKENKDTPKLAANLKDAIKKYELQSRRYWLPTPLGSLHVFIDYNQDRSPLEVFISQGKAGSNEKADREALGRAISKALQYGCPPEEIAETLIDIMGADVWFQNGRMYKSIPDAVGKILLDFIGKRQDVKQSREKCPSCGKYSIVYEGGCNKCLECGWSKCG